MRLFALALALVVTSTAHAGVITTTFATNNERFDGGNMFNATVFANPLLVTALDVHTDTTGPVTVSVYTKPGTYVGFENSPAAWTLQSQQTVTGAGRNNPTRVDVTDFLLAPNTLTGLYVSLSFPVTDTFNSLYTNGNNVYSNADLQLDLGKQVRQFGQIINSRTWNGTIYYDLAPVPEPATLAVFGGLAVAGAVGYRRRKAGA